MAAPKKQGIFARIGNWFREQAAQYKLQRDFGKKDKLLREFMAEHDKAFAEIDSRGLSPYDTAIQKFEHRKQEHALAKAGDPKAEAIGASIAAIQEGMEALDKCTEKLQNSAGRWNIDVSKSKGERFKTETEGWGIGAFFGRLFNGRSSKEARESGKIAQKRFLEETGFDRHAQKDYEKLVYHEAAVREGRMTPEQAMRTPIPVMEEAQAAHTPTYPAATAKEAGLGTNAAQTPQPAPEADREQLSTSTAEKQADYKQNESRHTSFADLSKDEGIASPAASAPVVSPAPMAPTMRGPSKG